MPKSNVICIKRVLAVVLSIVLLAAAAPALLITSKAQSAVTEEELNLARAQFFGSSAPDAAEMEAIAVEDSRIVHEPQTYIAPDELADTGETEEVPGGLALQDVQYPGPFAAGDRRLFRARVTSYDSQDKLVEAKLVSQGAHTNIWVLDDADYHAKTGTVHSSNCHLTDVTTVLAQDIANSFDSIYELMTGETGFGPHSGVIHQAAYGNVNQVGDFGDDGKINFLLYDLKGDGGNAGSAYTAGFFSNGDFFKYDARTNGIRPDGWTGHATYDYMNYLDMMHIDIGHNQGYTALQSTGADRLSTYSTLAHEFQHLLFYLYFGMYIDSSVVNIDAYSWFNEALSELAGTFYVQEGAEIADSSRLVSGARNSYEYGVNFGDFLNFNGSMKSYGIGSLFSASMYKRYGSGYVTGLYDAITAAFPPATNLAIMRANRDSVTDRGHDSIIGDFLKGGTGLGGGGRNSLQTVYTLFMEDFASDGGLMIGTDSNQQTTKFSPGTAEWDHLWAVRPKLGVSGTGGRVYGPNNTYRSVSSYEAIPALSSGGTVSLSAYGTNASRPATHEMFYLLSGSGTGTPILNIQINDNNPGTNYYIALPDDDYRAGAQLYPLHKDGTGNRIHTNGRPAYLYVSTFYRNVSTAPVFTWEAVGAWDLTGTVTLSNPAPAVGDTVTATVVANGSDYQYTWLLDGLYAASGSSNAFTIPDLAANVNKTLTVLVSTPAAGNALAVSSLPITKKANPAVPVAPVLRSSTSSGIVLAAVAGYEYSVGGILWQDEPEFLRLVPDTQYTFYQRIKATETTAASKSSTGLTVTTGVYHSIGLSVSGTHAFPAASYGYAAQAPLSVTLRNTGELATGTLTAQLSGADAASFSLSKTSFSSLASGGSTVFTLAPNTGLSAGTYAVTVTAGNDNTGYESFHASFEVTQAVITVADGTVTAKEYDGTTAAAVTRLTFSGLATGESLTFGTDYAVTSAVFNSASAGSGKSVAITFQLLNTAAANNYLLSSGTGTLTGKTIAKKGITVEGITAVKQYDGTKIFRRTDLRFENITIQGLVGEGTVTLVPPEEVGTLSSAAAGTKGKLTITGTFAIEGSYAKNYDLAEVPVIQARIIAADGTFPAADAIHAAYAPGLTLADLTDLLQPGYAWDEPATLLYAGNNQSFPATYTAPGGSYNPASGSITVHIAKAAGSFPAAAAISATYEPGLTLSKLALPAGYAWAVSSAALNAGIGQSFAATYTDASGNYLPAPGSITVHIAKAAAPALVWPVAAPITYGAPLSSAALAGGTKGYGTFAWANGSICPGTLNSGYTVTFTPADPLNYDWTATALTKTTNITVLKKSASQMQCVAQTLEVLANAERAIEYSFDLASLLPDITPLTYGSVSYTIAPLSADGISVSYPASLSGTSVLPVNVAAAAPGSYTVSGTISSDNIQTFAFSFTIRAAWKTPVEIYASISSKTYDGLPCGYSGTPAITDCSTGKAVTGAALSVWYVSTDGAGYASASPPVRAGKYRLTLSIPDSNPDYSGSKQYEFTIAKRQVTIKADDVTLKAGSAQPSYTCQASGFLGSDKLLVQPVITCPTANMNVPGTYPIVPSGGRASANYALVYQNGTLTVEAKSAAAEILGITSPANARRVSENTYEVSASFYTASVPVDVSVSENAAWGLYSDAACTNAIADKTLRGFAIGRNFFYIKITAENGSYKIFTLVIERMDAAAPTLTTSDTTVKYRGTIQLQTSAIDAPYVVWGGSNEYIKVHTDGTVESLKNFTKTGKATITATVGGQTTYREIKVKPSFGQWLMIIFLFGWIWM